MVLHKIQVLLTSCMIQQCATIDELQTLMQFASILFLGLINNYLKEIHSSDLDFLGVHEKHEGKCFSFLPTQKQAC